MRLFLELMVMVIVISCNETEPVQIVKTKSLEAKNQSCKEISDCSKIIQTEENCSNNYNQSECKQFIEYFIKLSDRSTCMRSFDTKTVPAIWVCGEGKGYPTIFDRSVLLLNKLISKFPFAKAFYASEKFRSILIGETAENNSIKSLVIENELTGYRGEPKKVFTKDNYNKLKSEWEGELLHLSQSNRKRLYDFLDVDAPRIQKPYLYINYKMLAKMIIEDHDLYGIQKYLRFIARTSGPADEERSVGLGSIYLKHTEHFLFELTLLDNKSKEIVIDSLLFGLGTSKKIAKIKGDKFHELHQSIIKKQKKFKK